MNLAISLLNSHIWGSSRTPILAIDEQHHAVVVHCNDMEFSLNFDFLWVTNRTSK